MEIRKSTTNQYVLNNRFGGEDMTFTIQRSEEDKVTYFIDFAGVEVMVNDDGLYDMLEMLKTAYKLAVEEEGAND